MQTAEATWEVLPGRVTEPDNKPAIYFYNLTEQERIFADKSLGINLVNYDFTTEDPNITNGTKTWINQVGDRESKYIEVEINDDGIYEEDFEEFVIQIMPKTMVYLTSEDIQNLSVIIIAPNNGKRGTIQFTETRYQVYEDHGVLQIPVERIEGSDGDISVEYSVINEKLAQTATFGRDYKELGVWQRIFHHECNYLDGLNTFQKSILDLRSAQRYFDIITKSGIQPGVNSSNLNVAKFLTDDFMKFQFNQSEINYRYPIEWNKGFGCCADKDRVTATTYPQIYDFQFLQFRMEWPFDSTIQFDQIWAQNELPMQYNLTHLSNFDVDLDRIQTKHSNTFGGLKHGPDVEPKYKGSWNGLMRCDSTETCVFRTEPYGYEIGVRVLEKDQNSLQYIKEYCLTGPQVGGQYINTNAVSLYIKYFSFVFLY